MRPPRSGPPAIRARNWTAPGLTGACLLASCASGVPTVPKGPHGAAAVAALIVDGAPPTAQVETVGAPPSPECAWLDGEWQYVDGDWLWRGGRWVMPPPDCYYAPPVASWVSTTGTSVLYYVGRQWYREGGKKLCSKVPECSARKR